MSAPYIELHAGSAFSFLDGASLPEEFIGACAEYNMPAMALLDRDGVYGAPRFHLAAGKPVFKRTSAPKSTSDNRHPLSSARRNARRLSKPLPADHSHETARTQRQRRDHAKRNCPEFARGLICLTGGEHGPLTTGIPGKTAASHDRALIDIFGRDNVYVELQRHYDREEEAINQQALSRLRKHSVFRLLATNGVRYASPHEREILDVFTCIRNHRTLETAGRLLAKNSERYLKTPRQMARLFADLPEAIANTSELSSPLAIHA